MVAAPAVRMSWLQRLGIASSAQYNEWYLQLRYRSREYKKKVSIDSEDWIRF